MITSSTTGVWWVDDVYKKENSFRYTTTGNLFSFGYNSSGQLGQNNTTNYSSPRQIPGFTWNSIATGFHHTVASKTDGTLWSWGRNDTGQLGLNNNTWRSSPVQIPGTTWSSVTCGKQHSLATKTDGTLWAWGDNGFGQTGTNSSSYVDLMTPVQIPGTTWKSVSANDLNALATKTDGTLWAWGNNLYGQLGQGTSGSLPRFSSPIQIPGTNWNSASMGLNWTLASKTDGTLWSWGRNQFGQLGQNNQTEYSSPVQIPGTTWSSVSAGGFFGTSIKTDGTLWAWGNNSSGQLAVTTDFGSFSSPVQIPGTTWKSVSASASHVLALKTDDTLWTWGSNFYGQSITGGASPTQVPGNWANISTNTYYHSLAIRRF